MPEVIVIATFKVKPGREQEVEQILERLIEPSQAEERPFRSATS